jgi:preprotein translocase subunit YajC
MFVTPAYAQAAGGGGAGDILVSLAPILLLIVIFWLLIFRPQQKRLKEHKNMLDSVRRGDTIVTTGGIVGKVLRVQENEDLEVEISSGVKVKVVRSMISDVRSKAEPVNDNKSS